MFRKIVLTAAVVLSTSLSLSNAVFASEHSFGVLSTLAQPLNFGDQAETLATSCPSAGNCTAVGYYYDVNHHSQAFISTQNHGVWHQAVEVGAALNVGNYAALESISCASAGNCSATGYVSDAKNRQQAMIMTEVNSVWSAAFDVATLMNLSGNADLYSVSCSANAQCAAVGWVGSGPDEYQSVIINEVNGLFGNWRGLGILSER